MTGAHANLKVMVVFGTRPEVIKLAPVILELQRRAAEGVEVCACLSGQHREMAHQALAVFGIKPDLDLDVMVPGQTLPGLTATLMTALSNAITEQKPDVVMVQGDTTTAFVAGLAAFYAGVPVAHVEAGLRTGDMQSPFPEEMNRVMLGRIVRWHFPPTQRAADNLLGEGVDPAHVLVTGNTVVDAIEVVRSRWDVASLADEIGLDLPRGKCVLVTTHRRENFGSGLQNIIDAVVELSRQHSDFTFVIPVHLNPNVRDQVHQKLSGLSNVLLLEPVSFEQSLYLQSISCLILTDSGGIQEEAPSFAVPTVVMREHTERREGIDAGFAVLAGADKPSILQAANAYLAAGRGQNQLKGKENPYGDGRAAKRIVAQLLAGRD